MATAGAAENFCLRWNDFEANVSVAFRELRDEADFFDVNLACDDTPAHARPLQAHKVILSACSGFFKKVLREQMANAGPAGLLATPYLYLRGVRYDNLELLLDFMYHGEVNVCQEQLSSFLETATDLEIKGLTNIDNKPKVKPALPTLPTLPTQPLPLGQANNAKKILKKPPQAANLPLAGASPAKRPRAEADGESETIKSELSSVDGGVPPCMDELASNLDEDPESLGGVAGLAEVTFGADDSSGADGALGALPLPEMYDGPGSNATRGDRIEHFKF